MKKLGSQVKLPQIRQLVKMTEQRSCSWPVRTQNLCCAAMSCGPSHWCPSQRPSHHSTHSRDPDVVREDGSREKTRKNVNKQRRARDGKKDRDSLRKNIFSILIYFCCNEIFFFQVQSKIYAKGEKSMKLTIKILVLVKEKLKINRLFLLIRKT